MGRYAEDTRVPVERSREQILSYLEKRDVDEIGFRSGRDGVGIAFSTKGITIQLNLPLPPLDKFRTTDKGRERCESAVQEAHAKEVRRVWRALFLLIKAKFEAIDAGISTFLREFLADVMVAGQKRVGEVLIPRLEVSGADGRLCRLALPAPSEST